MKQRKMLMIRKAFLVIAMGLQISQARTPTEILKELQDSSAKVLNKIDIITSPIENLCNAIEAAPLMNFQQRNRSLDFALFIATLVFEDSPTVKRRDATLEELGSIDSIKNDIITHINAQILNLTTSGAQCLNEMVDKHKDTACTDDQLNRAKELHKLINQGCSFYQQLASAYASIFDGLSDIENFNKTLATQVTKDVKNFLQNSTLLWLQDPAYQTINPFGRQLKPVLNNIDAIQKIVMPLYCKAVQLMGSTSDKTVKFSIPQELLKGTENQISGINNLSLQIKDFLCASHHPLSEIVNEEAEKLYAVYNAYYTAATRLLDILKKGKMNMENRGYIAMELAPSITYLRGMWNSNSSLKKVTFREENLLETYFAKESLLKGLNKVTLGN